MSVAQGGNFASGFLAAGVGSLAGHFYGGDLSIGKLILGAGLGGAASALGGGKFANGAITGAFAYAAGSLARGGIETDPPLAGKDITITIGSSVPQDEQAGALDKVEAAVQNINQSSLSPYDISVLNSLNGIEVDADISRSFTNPDTGVFHIDLLELGPESVPFVSSTILHDAFHEYLYNTCGSGCYTGDVAERQATEFQFSVTLHNPVSQWEVNQTWNYINNPQALHQRENQPPGP